MYRRVYRQRPDADRSSRTLRRRRALGAVDDRHAQENRLMAPERRSSGVIWHVTMSLDGFIAGPNDSMDWVVARWGDHGGKKGEITVRRSALADEILHAAGAILGGRRWYDVAVRQFDGYDGIYGGQWKGPVFVLTHRPPDANPHPAITFIPGPVSEAVATAKDAAAGNAVI